LKLKRQGFPSYKSQPDTLAVDRSSGRSTGAVDRCARGRPQSLAGRSGGRPTDCTPLSSGGRSTGRSTVGLAWFTGRSTGGTTVIKMTVGRSIGLSTGRAILPFARLPTGRFWWVLNTHPLELF